MVWTRTPSFSATGTDLNPRPRPRFRTALIHISTFHPIRHRPIRSRQGAMIKRLRDGPSLAVRPPTLASNCSLARGVALSGLQVLMGLILLLRSAVVQVADILRASLALRNQAAMRLPLRKWFAS